MKKYDRQKKIRIRKAVAVFLAVIVIALMIEQQLAWLIVKKGAERSTSLLLNQIETVIEDNKQDEEDRTAELKEYYISDAETIGYILSTDPGAADDIDTLEKIAEYEQVDEIHIFDETGTIISGTVPEYYGYSFDSGEQMGYFKPMLDDKTLAMCQDVTPNTAEGKSMMYAIAWNEEGTMMIQVGIEPVRLLEQLESHTIEKVVDSIPLSEGFNIYAVDPETKELVATTNDDDLYEGIAAEYAGAIGSSENHSGAGIVKRNGVRYYCNYRLLNGYIIAVAYDMSASSDSMFMSLGVTAVYMILAGILVLVLYLRLMNSELEKEHQILELEEYQTALAKSRDAAEEANRAKSTFLFNMSHDIRTPMNAIIGYTDLTIQHYDDKEKCMDYLHKSQEANKFLLSLINNVLEMARIESGKSEVEETVTKLGGITDEMKSMFENQMREKNIRFTIETDVHTEYVFCDRPKVHEIYLNILSNAYKYTPEGGSVSVRLMELEPVKDGYARVQLTISDIGIGMSEEFLPHLFEQFSRARTSTESRQEGTGLGMSIVKKLVDLMGGTIKVESAPNQGTTFFVMIDYRIAEPAAEERTGTEETKQVDFTGKRILLAEDNDLNAEIADAILSDVGFVTERAEDGAVCVDMLEKADAGYYDLILMDIQMPNMDGYTAARTIRSLDDKEKASIPIIAMTANAFEEDKKNALDAGMNGHLAKPVEVDKLFETLTEIFK